MDGQVCRDMQSRRLTASYQRTPDVANEVMKQ